MADNKDKKVLNVPALRFPEFTGEWSVKSISDLANVIGGGTPDTTIKSYWNGNIQWFTPSEIGKTKYVELSLRTITLEGLNNSNAKLLPPYTILLSSRATVGECSIALQECATNQGFQSLIAKNCDIDFLYYLIQTKKKDLIRKACGSTFLEISANEIRKIHTNVPSNAEQKKIGALLSLIDKRIETQNKIIEKYESLIQAIIYRAKMDGIRKGTWRKIDLCKVLQERNEKNVEGRTICSVSVSQGVVNQIEYLGRSFAAKQTSHYNIVKYGDIVYTKSPTGNFPYGIIKRSNIREDVAVSPLYGVYIPASDSIGVFLHFYFMQPSNAFNYLHPLIQKGAKNTINITNGRFLENSVLLPISKSEANTIAGILKTIQAKIEIEKNLLQSYTEEKEYLLRQMFI